MPYLIAIAWMYIATMMALAEAFSPNGTVAGALATFFLYGILPLSIILYIVLTPARRRAARARTQQRQAGADEPASTNPARTPDPPH